MLLGCVLRVVICSVLCVVISCVELGWVLLNVVISCVLVHGWSVPAVLVESRLRSVLGCVVSVIICCKVFGLVLCVGISCVIVIGWALAELVQRELGVVLGCVVYAVIFL